MLHDGALDDWMSDGELARRIASEPAGAADLEEAELYRRFAPRVRLYGRKHLGDESAAQDLAQQVMLVTISRLRASEIRNPDEIGSFIFGTSRMMAQSVRRTSARRQTLADSMAVPEYASPPDTISLDRARMEQCLESLDAHARAVVILSFYAEKNSVEIAAELGSTSGAVRLARHRALERLRNCMGLVRMS